MTGYWAKSKRERDWNKCWNLLLNACKNATHTQHTLCTGTQKVQYKFSQCLFFLFVCRDFFSSVMLLFGIGQHSGMSIMNYYEFANNKHFFFIYFERVKSEATVRYFFVGDFYRSQVSSTAHKWKIRENLVSRSILLGFGPMPIIPVFGDLI